MTSTNITYYFDDVSVERNDKSYKVVFEDRDTKVFVRKADVDKIYEYTYYEDGLIAILLGYIELSRRLGSAPKEHLDPIDKDVMLEAIKKIFDKGYFIEELIEDVQEFKWHEITEVFTSAHPFAALKNLV